MTDEELVRAYLAAQSTGDVETLRTLVTDDVELYGRKGLAARGVDELVAVLADGYSHLDDVYTLERLDGSTALAREELRWRESGELSAHRQMTLDLLLRDGRIAKVERVAVTPWEQA